MVVSQYKYSNNVSEGDACIIGMITYLIEIVTILISLVVSVLSLI